MNSLIKDVEEISARKLGILGARVLRKRRRALSAVRMFLRGPFPCVFFLAINVDRPEQCAELLRSLQAVYRRFCQEQGLLGHSVRTVRSMQNLQMPCPARFSA